MSQEFTRCGIYRFNCCDEGRAIDQASKKNQDQVDVGQTNHHFFLVLSDNDYTKAKQNRYISVVPLSSTANNYTKQTHGFTIDDDAVGDTGRIFVGSIILCDRPMRIFKEYNPDGGAKKGELNFNAYRKIVTKIAKHCGIKLDKAN